MKPDVISLEPEDASRLRKLNDKRASNAAFAEQVRAAGERRNMDLITEGRALWSEIAKKYGLDIQHAQYDLNAEGTGLDTLAVQYGGGQ